jgi:hypothetical protein
VLRYICKIYGNAMSIVLVLFSCCTFTVPVSAAHTSLSVHVRPLMSFVASSWMAAYFRDPGAAFHQGAASARYERHFRGT